MPDGPTTSGFEGHLNGGPLRFRGVRRVLPLVPVALALGCATASETRAPAPGGDTFARPLEIYHDLGFMTGSTTFPAVADVATLAGPADSTFVLLALSLPNSALRFQRDAHGFFAEYRVEIALLNADSLPVRRLSAREIVRVPTFAETTRTDESIVFQKAIAAAPGPYIVRVEAGDAHSARGFRAADTLTVPDYSRGGLSSILFVHEAGGRSARDSLPFLILNPRRTVSYGAEAPRLYIESYHAAPLSLSIVDAEGDTVWRAVPDVDVGSSLAFATVEIPAEVLPVGRFDVVASALDARQHAALVMTISDQWIVGSMEDVLALLELIAHDEEIDSLRTGTPAQRRAAWDRFWKQRDPLPITAPNEYRDEFFQRVRYVAEAFREAGTNGWTTDRGQVYIVLGPPDQIAERIAGLPDITGQMNAVEWMYVNAPGGRVSLVFHDRTGSGRLELAPSSAATFRGILQRLRSRNPR